ncbi:hypothetical protein [Terasakiella pusilla]|uniref:hypothetical protein n=1 Tax=Terasakiella pusilla TaxID=64973 RepID=UPI00048B9C58|nr:hypothetical protein [Terasakiella pusilla]
MMKISIVPISFQGTFPMGYSLPNWLCSKMEIGGHSVLVSTLETETVLGDICQIKVTGRLVIPHELEDGHLEQIKDIESGSCFSNGVTAQVWNVKTKVAADNIIIIDLDGLQNAMNGSTEKPKDFDYKCRSYSDLDLAHLDSLVKLLAGES